MMRCNARESFWRGMVGCLVLTLAVLPPGGCEGSEPTSLSAEPRGGADQAVGTFFPARPADAKITLAGSEHYDTVALERGEAIEGTFTLGRPVPREGATMIVRVSDSMGRLLVDREMPVPAGGGPLSEWPFRIDVPDVQAMLHYIDIFVQPAEGDAQGDRSQWIYMRPTEWNDYTCTIWHRHNDQRIPYLQDMYLIGTQWNSASSAVPDYMIRRNYYYYLEGGAPWVFSPYHMWFPDKAKTHYFQQAVAEFIEDRSNPENYERIVDLCNPFIQDRVEYNFMDAARMHRPYRPIFYTIADEPGIGNQAAAYDFGYSKWAKRAFREWLQVKYGGEIPELAGAEAEQEKAILAEIEEIQQKPEKPGLEDAQKKLAELRDKARQRRDAKALEALNKQWDTDFENWKDVVGETTDEVFAREDDNFSAWCDHKDFMDSALIDLYALAGDTAKRFDPKARIGYGGGQGPAAVGGWDFWKLTHALDVMENYYIGNNYELVRSFNPDVIPIHCSFGKGGPEKHLIWYCFLHGDRGLLVWDTGAKYVNDEGEYSDRAKEAKEWYRELTGGIGMLKIASKRTDDPIALYHSQPNLRVHWVLEVRPEGENWVHRNSWSERIRSRYFRLRESWVKLIEDNGYQYTFLAPPMVHRGDLKVYDPDTGGGFKVLLLPDVKALSMQECEAIRAFVKAGGTVLADQLPGEFDEHGKRREASPLAELFEKNPQGRAILLSRDMLPYYHHRLYPEGHPQSDDALKILIGELLADGLDGDRVTPEVVGQDGKPVTGVEVTLFRNGKADMIALHRNPQLRVHELGPQEYKKNDKFEAPVDVTVRHPVGGVWYDVRAGRKLGEGKEATVSVLPFEPTVVMVLPDEAGAFQAVVTEEELRITPGRPNGLARSVYHLDFIGPDGQERKFYRCNISAGPEGTAMPLPLALNDQAGLWTLKITETATGRTQDVTFRHR